MKRRNPHATEEWVQKLPSFVRRLENELYNSAQSKQEYLSAETFQQRLQSVANRMSERERQRQAVLRQAQEAGAAAGPGSGAPAEGVMRAGQAPGGGAMEGQYMMQNAQMPPGGAPGGAPGTAASMPMGGAQPAAAPGGAGPAGGAGRGRGRGRGGAGAMPPGAPNPSMQGGMPMHVGQGSLPIPPSTASLNLTQQQKEMLQRGGMPPDLTEAQRQGLAARQRYIQERKRREQEMQRMQMAQMHQQGQMMPPMGGQGGMAGGRGGAAGSAGAPQGPGAPRGGAAPPQPWTGPAPGSGPQPYNMQQVAGRPGPGGAMPLPTDPAGAGRGRGRGRGRGGAVPAASSGAAPGQTQVMNGMNAGQPLSDAQRRELQEQHQRRWLMLLRHASDCRAPPGTCQGTPHCANMKVLWDHVVRCVDTKCTYPKCIQSRGVLSHYHKCKNMRCNVCGIVHQYSQQKAAHEAAQRAAAGGGGMMPRGNMMPMGAGPDGMPMPFPGAAGMGRGSMTPDQMTAQAQYNRMMQHEQAGGMVVNDAAGMNNGAAPKGKGKGKRAAGADGAMPPTSKKAKSTPNASQRLSVLGAGIQMVQSGLVPQLQADNMPIGQEFSPEEMMSIMDGQMLPSGKRPTIAQQKELHGQLQLAAALAKARRQLTNQQILLLRIAHQMKQKQNQRRAQQVTDPVSLMDTFTKEQVDAHVESLRAGKSAQEVAHQALATGACMLCGFLGMNFEPPALYCRSPGCGARIKRNHYYFCTTLQGTAEPALMGKASGASPGEKNLAVFCQQCYTTALEDEIDVDGETVQRQNLLKKKNDEISEEPWVACDRCEGWAHQVCALFNRERNDAGTQGTQGELPYYCPHCRIADKIRKPPQQPKSKSKAAAEAYQRELQKFMSMEPIPPARPMHGARDLMRSHLSDFIERRLAAALTAERQVRAVQMKVPEQEVPTAHGLTIRVLSHVDKATEMMPRFGEFYQKRGATTSLKHKSKCIVLFQRRDHVDVILFIMYVQEYGADAPHPNERKVYLSYLDSVKFFEPSGVQAANGDLLRTFVYHQILIGYMAYIKRRGFCNLHIWACPPMKGDDYILYCKPDDQKQTKADRLRAWYRNMLVAAMADGVVHSVSNLFDCRTLQYGAKDDKKKVRGPQGRKLQGPVGRKKTIKDEDAEDKGLGKAGKKNTHGSSLDLIELANQDGQQMQIEENTGLASKRKCDFHRDFFDVAYASLPDPTPADLPYFEGDYWPGLAEEIFFETEAANKAAEKIERESKGATSRQKKNKLKEKKYDKALPEGVSMDAHILSRLREVVNESKSKEDFIIVHLYPSCSVCAKPIVSPVPIDPQTLKLKVDPATGKEVKYQKVHKWHCIACGQMDICEECFKHCSHMKFGGGTQPAPVKIEDITNGEADGKDHAVKEEPTAVKTEAVADGGTPEKTKAPIAPAGSEATADVTMAEGEAVAAPAAPANGPDATEKSAEAEPAAEAAPVADVPSSTDKGPDDSVEASRGHTPPSKVGEVSPSAKEAVSKSESPAVTETRGGAEEESGTPSGSTRAKADGADEDAAGPMEIGDEVGSIKEGSMRTGSQANGGDSGAKDDKGEDADSRMVKKEEVEEPQVLNEAEEKARAANGPYATHMGLQGAAAADQLVTSCDDLTMAPVADKGDKSAVVGVKEETTLEEKLKADPHWPFRRVPAQDVYGVCIDRDISLENEVFDTRQSFLSMQQANNYQFDTLRRGKFSTMMVLWNTHNPPMPQVNCDNCNVVCPPGTGYHCSECEQSQEYFDLCNKCYTEQKVKHPHKMHQHQLPVPGRSRQGMSNANSGMDGANAQARFATLKRHLALLDHSSHCALENCPADRCSKMKSMIQHAQQCERKRNNECHMCQKFFWLVQVHARSCRRAEGECQVLFCPKVRQHIMAKQREIDVRRNAQVSAMMRQRAAVAAAQANPSNSMALAPQAAVTEKK